MDKKALKSLICILLAVFCSLTLMAREPADQLTDSLNQVARDIHYSSRMVDSSDEAAAAAFAKEGQSVEKLERFFHKVESEQQINDSLNQLRFFAYRISNNAEKAAFKEALRIIEKRVKYLVQTENPQLSGSIENIHALKTEFETSQTFKEPDFSRRLKEITRSTGSKDKVPSELLGAHVQNGKTEFSVYSPAATQVNLVLFKEADDKKGRSYAMKKDSNGTWRATIKEELYGTFYGFTADGPTTDGHLFDPDRLLSDPYAFANVGHNGKSVVVNRNFKWTDGNFSPPAAKDAIIYEMHIKDYTAHKTAGVSADKRGKYLGMLEGKNSDKILGHLKDLGVNCLELLPVHEFDNNYAGVTNHWGYMTTHFFAPESSYASGNKGEAVNEFKTLVNGLHNEGFAVIMDVVYNHTAEGDHRGKPLNFKGFDNPGYYRLMDDKKYYWNGSGCGNEFRSDSPVGRKMIIDSLKYWIDEYHVDGFRFDLGTIIDKHTFGRILDELPEDIIVVAEPWAADWKRNQWGKSDFRNTRLGKWNDDYRENIRSFVSGNGNRNDVMTVLAGTCFWWTAKPTESLNYIEAHDGYTLFDLYNGDKKKTRLAAIALLTSQGIPMIHEGQEFNRSKDGNHNSYDQDNETNWINWNDKKDNLTTFELYKGLIALRKKYDNFKHATALNSQSLDWILPGNQNGVGMVLKGKPTFIVLLNSDQSNWVNFKLPAGTWKVICNGEKVKEAGLYTAEGDYNVPPVTGIILRQ
ncbi:MAG: alpha-amylase family glycosyl hydrolase [Candidatus Rifleibacteriota bacterium]